MGVWTKSAFRYRYNWLTVYYGRDYEKKKERQKKTKKKEEALAMAMKNSLKNMPRGIQVKRDGLAITVERRDTSSEIALRHLSLPGSMSSLQGTTLQERPEAQVSGVRLSKQSGLKAPGGPHTSSHPNYT